MEPWAAVDELIGRLLTGDAPQVDAGGLPPHEVSPPQGKLLELLARSCGAARILELGTLAGYSTLWLARGLRDGGRIVTLEADPAAAAVARANIERAGMGDVVELIEGAALDTLPGLRGPFDLVFIDADKRSNPAYLEHALRLTRPGSEIVADNVVRGGAVLDPQDDSARGARAFLELLSAESRVDATVIQTVGAKGHDGFALAVVR
ncbi:MAG: O-methyltransferase [Solirubrobacteraceae bacterium]|nr:O-methyltransferase [Solirubrobacteraceae bacterium]